MIRSILILLVVASPSWAGWSRSYRSSSHSCVKKVFVPVERTIVQRFIEQPYIENVFYAVGASVRDYSVAPRNLMLAQQGQLYRQLERIQDQLAYYQDQYEAPPQQYYYPPPTMQWNPGYGQAPQNIPLQQSYAPPPQAQRAAPSQYELPAPPTQQLAACPGPQSVSNHYDHGQALQQRVTDQKCIGCHNNQKSEGNLNMQQPLTFQQKLHGFQRAMKGDMPKDGEPLNEDELRRYFQEEFSPEEQEAVRRAFNGPANNGGGQMPPPEQ